MNWIPDFVALTGLLAIAVGVYLLSGLGWALVALGSGLYLTAIFTVWMNASIANRNNADQ